MRYGVIRLVHEQEGNFEAGSEYRSPMPRRRLLIASTEDNIGLSESNDQHILTAQETLAHGSHSALPILHGN